MRSANAHELLRASATNDEKKVAELLMAGGNDIRQAVNDALSISARRGYTKIVKLLLGGGADGNGLGGEARRWAIEKGHTETAKVLEDWMASHRPSRPSQPPT